MGQVAWNKQYNGDDYSQVDASSLTADQLSVREAVHSLLTSLCSSVKLGIVFHDKSFGSTKQFCIFQFCKFSGCMLMVVV